MDADKKDMPAIMPHLNGGFPEPGQISALPVPEPKKVTEPALPATTLEKPIVKNSGWFKGFIRAMTLGALFGGAVIGGSAVDPQTVNAEGQISDSGQAQDSQTKDSNVALQFEGPTSARAQGVVIPTATTQGAGREDIAATDQTGEVTAEGVAQVDENIQTSVGQANTLEVNSAKVNGSGEPSGVDESGVGSVVQPAGNEVTYPPTPSPFIPKPTNTSTDAKRATNQSVGLSEPTSTSVPTPQPNGSFLKRIFGKK